MESIPVAVENITILHGEFHNLNLFFHNQILVSGFRKHFHSIQNFRIMLYTVSFKKNIYSRFLWETNFEIHNWSVILRACWEFHPRWLCKKSASWNDFHWIYRKILNLEFGVLASVSTLEDATFLQWLVNLADMEHKVQNKIVDKEYYHGEMRTYDVGWQL